MKVQWRFWLRVQGHLNFAIVQIYSGIISAGRNVFESHAQIVSVAIVCQLSLAILEFQQNSDRVLKIAVASVV